MREKRQPVCDFLLTDHCSVAHDIDHWKNPTVPLSIQTFLLLKRSGCATNRPNVLF